MPATAKYLPIKMNAITSRSTKGKKFKVPVHHAKKTTASHKKGQFVRDKSRARPATRPASHKSKARRNPLDSHKPGCRCIFHSGKMFKHGKSRKNLPEGYKIKWETPAAQKRYHDGRYYKHFAHKWSAHADWKKPRAKGKTRKNSPRTELVAYKPGKKIVYRARSNPLFHVEPRDTWGSVAIKTSMAVATGLLGLAVAFGGPKLLAVASKKTRLQEGFVGAGLSAGLGIGVSAAVYGIGAATKSDHVKRFSLVLLGSSLVGSVLYLGYALWPTAIETVIPVQEALLAAHLGSVEQAPASQPPVKPKGQTGYYEDPSMGQPKRLPLRTQAGQVLQPATTHTGMEGVYEEDLASSGWNEKAS